MTGSLARQERIYALTIQDFLWKLNISRIENDKYKPNPRTIFRLADELEVVLVSKQFLNKL